MVLDIAVHDCWSLLLSACGEAVHHGRSVRQKKSAHIINQGGKRKRKCLGFPNSHGLGTKPSTLGPLGDIYHPTYSTALTFLQFPLSWPPLPTIPFSQDLFLKHRTHLCNPSVACSDFWARPCNVAHGAFVKLIFAPQPPLQPWGSAQGLPTAGAQ